MFHDIKRFIIDLTLLSRDAMHIHVGMAIFLLIWLLWRWRGARLVAWLGALCAALGGEILDHIAITSDITSLVWLEHWKDIFSTMLWPTFLALFIGFLPYVSRKTQKVAQDIGVTEKFGNEETASEKFASEETASEEFASEELKNQ